MSEFFCSVLHLSAPGAQNGENNNLMSIYPMYTRKITHWFARRSFQNRIFLLILFTSTIVMLAMSWYLTDITEERLHYQVGQRALIQAMQISAMPELVEAVQKRDLARIKALIDPMRSFSDATYITVGDASGQRLYHVNPDEIGKSMEGGDSDEALINAKSYVSVRKGSLGSSLRGKSPIQDATGKVIGIVSVGYTIEQLENWLSLQISSLLIPMAIMLLLLLFCARRFSLHIKKQMLNMEPQQLSQLLIQQSVLFESVFEGLIAIDSDYKITAINQTARRLLNLSQPEPTLIGKRISSVISQEVFFYDAPQTNKKDEIVTFNQIKVIASRMAVILNNEPQGWVISFRSKDDINTLSLQLSQVQQYADNLRAVQHEHRNLISTIAGLLFLKRYNQALELIQQQSESHQKVIDFIARNFQDNHLAGLLIGKYYRAKELGLELIFDPACFVDRLPTALSHNEWISIVGNLLDNAYNASLRQPQGSKQIECLINSDGQEVIIEIADQGCGIDEALRDRIFERGVTSSASKDHGIGLWLVRSYVEQAGGSIVVENNIPFGTIFTLYIPLTRDEHHG
ncbi:signal transduction histidine kinase regulating citrate/malate metabolism [Klebsiella pneumoniae]|nr:signal transduction histidine kinase regulating citrate/malate metabolism [Klebsiella pneumoniae]SWL83764.1 signal transduction histidine kinase regulating citrate/malate metabolism [Klebsiella pneumoniae]SWM09177.1 signal transduction histidine kinase regulating citrate/malate metabolism [Klebsiella pneumoniae]SWM39791.1 signal transduction histidine kinase regulating citrate/malate metabolism [Klebsiella pneumoniae]SWM49147.1 signal transduction histidine kinase regulating citrate/malate m